MFLSVPAAKAKGWAPTLRYGNYEQLLVAHEQFPVMRRDESETIAVALKAAADRCSERQRIIRTKRRQHDDDAGAALGRYSQSSTGRRCVVTVG
jgi:hypothetical protein